ncbi:MAG: hypothetical protein IIC69_01630 [Nanoarchaeota archaeon]|nr:hypothetical protein [Nanoarchaeota archaeon]
MNYRPERYTILMYQIESPSQGRDFVGGIFGRAQTYRKRGQDLDEILRKYNLNQLSSEEEVKLATRSASFSPFPEGYRDDAIIKLVYDIMPK